MQKLQGECQRLVDLSNDFLHFARLKDVPLEPAELGKIVEEMIDFFTPTARSANIDIKSFLPADLPTLRLEQGTVRARRLLELDAQRRAGDAAGRRVDVSGVGRERPCALSLIDTGAGIAAGLLPKIFQPFFSTKSKSGGSGLGLPTTKKIIEAHHGTIEVQSETRQGDQVHHSAAG